MMSPPPSTSQQASTAAIQRSTGHASLAALGVWSRCVSWICSAPSARARPYRAEDRALRYAPPDKRYDAFIALLAGAQGVVEITGRLRPDPGLQAAFGRTACAEQSVVQETLDACTQETLTQLEQALDAIYRQHSAGYRQAYQQRWQVLDVDLSGLACPVARRPRWPRRAILPSSATAAAANSVACWPPTPTRSSSTASSTAVTQLVTALLPLVLAAEQTLELDAAKRPRTLIGLDAGAGSGADIHWLLFRGYHVLAKD